MFYNDPQYEIISEELIPSDTDSEEDKRLPEFWDIKGDNTNTLTMCPDCKVPLNKKNKDYKTIYEYNQTANRIERVTISSQRYRCRKCGKTKHAELSVKDITRTTEFNKKICELMLKDGFSSTKLAKRYKRSPKLISDITHEYTRDMMLTFTPPEGCKTLYLCPFMYQSKKRYYLGGVLDDKAYLLAFFGHVNAMDEIIRYFGYQINYERASAGPVIVTEIDANLIAVLTTALTDPVITFIPSLLRQMVLEHGEDHGDEFSVQYEKASRVEDLVKRLFGPVPPNTRRETKINEWRKAAEDRDEMQRLLGELIKRMRDYRKECAISYRYIDTEALFSDIDKDIQLYLSKNLSFDVLTARLMHKAYGEYATSEHAADMFKIDDNYDPFTETYYREPLIPISIKDIKPPVQKEVSSSLLGDIFGFFPSDADVPESFKGLDGGLPFGPNPYMEDETE